MSMDTQQIISPQLELAYYVMNLREEHWVQISETYLNLEEAKQAYKGLLKEYPFARMGGSLRQVEKKE